MAEISKITLPSGNTYDIKDLQSRQDIESLKEFTASGVQYVGVTVTALTDGATTPTTISLSKGDTSEDYTVKKGDMVSYNNVMYAWNGSQWDELGSAGELKALAYKDTVTGSVTPSGIVSKPSFTGNEETISVSGTPSGTVGITASEPASGETANYTPSGTVTVDEETANINEIDSVGSLPSLSATVDNETLILNFSAGTLPTKKAVNVSTGVKSASFSGKGQVIKGTFTGNELKSSGDYTPKGDVSQPTFKGNSDTVTSK